MLRTLVLWLFVLFMIGNTCSWHANALESQLKSDAQIMQGIDDAIKNGALQNGNDNTTEYQTNSSDNVDNVDDVDKLPSEIQKAVCTVTAGEVKASAEAVTTKTLKGVCGTAEMKLAFSDLEAKIYKEMQEIKLLLQQLTKIHGIHLPPTTVKHEHDTPAPTTSTTGTTSTTTPILNATKKIFEFQPIKSENTELKKVIKFKSLESQKAPVEREKEVIIFNNTMLTDRDFKVFTYYWKLENFTERIERDLSSTVESPIFSIKGKALQLKASFQHMRRDFLYLQLSYAKLNSNNRHNIILDMGGLFKEIKQADHVLFKHKISILDQNNQRSKDLISPEFNNLEMGFSIPNSALFAGPYIKNDSLLIQIFLYL